MLQIVCFRRSCNRLILQADRETGGNRHSQRGEGRWRDVNRPNRRLRARGAHAHEGQGRGRGLSATRYATVDPTAQIDKDNKVSDTKK